MPTDVTRMVERAKLYFQSLGVFILSFWFIGWIQEYADGEPPLFRAPDLLAVLIVAFVFHTVTGTIWLFTERENRRANEKRPDN